MPEIVKQKVKPEAKIIVKSKSIIIIMKIVPIRIPILILLVILMIILMISNKI